MLIDDAESRLEALIDEYTPAIAALARAALARVRARVPGAVELVYDNYNALVVGLAPNERASDAVLSVALYPRWVTLFFLHGAALPDPHGVLRGEGNQVRQVRLDSADVVDTPAVAALVAEAVARSDPPFDPSRPRRLVMKSVSAKRRPRRPG